MTRVDFYILPDEVLTARQAFACRLIQKTSRMGHKVYIHCSDETSAREIDKLLWSFQKQSFIPHKLLNTKGADCAIEIGYGDNPGDHHDVLLNLSLEVPSFFSRFNRIAEIVVQEPTVLDATRNSYKHYAHKNYPLHRHDMR